MAKEMFPLKKTGDGLAASHVNDMGRVLTNLSGGNQGSGLQGSSGWITGIAGRIGPFLTLAKIREETSTAGVYTIRFRYWDASDSLWKDETDDYELDARCFSHDAADPQRAPKLVYGDFLSVRYDVQRGLWVPDQFLFPNSRWAWFDDAIQARDATTVYSGDGKLVEETLNPAGDEVAWTFLRDADDNEIIVKVFNGYDFEVPANEYTRIGWDSIGQYEAKHAPPAEGGLVECCLAEDHPGYGVVFTVKLMVWDEDNNGHKPDPDDTETHYAIDWRYGTPYPDAGARGLFKKRRGYCNGAYVDMYEVVSLDCSPSEIDCTEAEVASCP